MGLSLFFVLTHPNTLLGSFTWLIPRHTWLVQWSTNQHHLYCLSISECRNSDL